jgi:hypothetical protein
MRRHTDVQLLASLRRFSGGPLLHPVASSRVGPKSSVTNTTNHHCRSQLKCRYGMYSNPCSCRSRYTGYSSPPHHTSIESRLPLVPHVPISPETWRMETGGWSRSVSRRRKSSKINCPPRQTLSTLAGWGHHWHHHSATHHLLSWSACGYAPRGCGPSQLPAELAWVTGTVTHTRTQHMFVVLFATRNTTQNTSTKHSSPSTQTVTQICTHTHTYIPAHCRLVCASIVYHLASLETP